MRFFFDAGIAITYVEALRILVKTYQRYDLVHLSERFLPHTKDVDWIQALAADGDWVIHFSRSAHLSIQGGANRLAGVWVDRILLRRSLGKNLQFWKQAESLVRWWPDIALQASKTPRGTGYLIPLQGREFKKIYPPD